MKQPAIGYFLAVGLGAAALLCWRKAEEKEAELQYLRQVSASLDYAKSRAFEERDSWQRTFESTAQILAECECK